MKLEVPDATLEETTQCPLDFVCLSTGECGVSDKCTVDYANGENVLFLTSKEPVSCPYRIHFAHGLLCTCPAHFAIYQLLHGKN